MKDVFNFVNNTYQFCGNLLSFRQAQALCRPVHNSITATIKKIYFCYYATFPDKGVNCILVVILHLLMISCPYSVRVLIKHH